MVELRHGGVAVSAEDAEDVGLLLGGEDAAAQLIAGVGAVAAEVALHGGAQGGDVSGPDRCVEAGKAVSTMDEANLLEHRAAFALACRGEDGGAILSARKHLLACKVTDATVGLRTVEKAEDIAAGDVLETEVEIVVCHRLRLYSIGLIIFSINATSSSVRPYLR